MQPYPPMGMNWELEFSHIMRALGWEFFSASTSGGSASEGRTERPAVAAVAGGYGGCRPAALPSRLTVVPARGFPRWKAAAVGAAGQQAAAAAWAGKQRATALDIQRSTTPPYSSVFGGKSCTSISKKKEICTYDNSGLRVITPLPPNKTELHLIHRKQSVDPNITHTSRRQPRALDCAWASGQSITSVRLHSFGLCLVLL